MKKILFILSAFLLGSMGCLAQEVPHDAAIAATDIRFWVGDGSRHAILAVCWADTCLAWGYRFEGDDATVKTMLDDIVAADSRLSATSYAYGISDILFATGADTLRLTTDGYNYWWLNRNGLAVEVDYNLQFLADGDFFKFGDANHGIATDSNEFAGVFYPSQYVWLTAVTPVDVPASFDGGDGRGPFCDRVGTAGCSAIAADSAAITAWASSCLVSRGWQDIATQRARASYGDESMALGPVTLTDNLHVVSLGDGGTATLTFDGAIYDGEGPDFAVFENGFDDAFLELAFVEVSSDGERFVRFPATSLTQTATQTDGMGTTDPTMLNNLAGKYRMGYGTPFDLRELRDSAGLDINHVTHVRLVDVVGSIDPALGSYDAFGHLVNDPYPTDFNSSGFDLAGIGAIHLTPLAIGDVESGATPTLRVFPNPAHGLLHCHTSAAASVELYDMQGRRLLRNRSDADGRLTITLGNIPSGLYLLRSDGKAQKVMVR